MISLAGLERGVRERADLSLYDGTHLHRATIEDAMGRVRGRERIRERALVRLAEEARGAIQVDVDSDEMIAIVTPGGWREHRWVMREGDRIVAVIEVVDGAARAAALGRDMHAAAKDMARDHPLHAPLGELRPGRGQLAASDSPDLPTGVPDRARAAAQWLDRFWNARALDRAPATWRGPAEAGPDATAFALRLLSALPDAVCLIERAVCVQDQVAVLWRLHGHHLGPGFDAQSRRRVRLIGSSVIALHGDDVVAEDMIIDTLALRATAYRPLINYSE